MLAQEQRDGKLATDRSQAGNQTVNVRVMQDPGKSTCWGRAKGKQPVLFINDLYDVGSCKNEVDSLAWDRPSLSHLPILNYNRNR